MLLVYDTLDGHFMLAVLAQMIVETEVSRLISFGALSVEKTFLPVNDNVPGVNEIIETI